MPLGLFYRKTSKMTTSQAYFFRVPLPILEKLLYNKESSLKFQFIEQSLPLGEGAPKGRMRVEQMRLNDEKRKIKR